MTQTGRKYSKKRAAILELLCSTKEHPSAEWIYSRLKPAYPDLSLGTVYRNLNLFLEQGEIISVGNFAGQERYDGNVHPHPHFICTACSRIIDLDLSFSAADHYADVEKAIGGLVQSECVAFTGLCKDCLSAQDASRASNT